MAVNDQENNRTQGQTQVPTAENTVGYLQGNHSDGGHLTASSSFFPKRKVRTNYEKFVIDIKEAVSYLTRQSTPLWWTATFVRLKSKQFSCLVFFPGEEAELRKIPTQGIFTLQRFFTWTNKATDIQWRDIPAEARKVSIDGGQSLKLVTGEVGSLLPYAGLAFMPGDTVDARLILYHDMTMSEALAQLPEIPDLPQIPHA
ncbi:Uncharacterized protein HZ326_28371 [Fusarium oxysporum f. sp. albedinis]|nr:Uncharacterized protein HZ326_28371 [Fusarium oxysporum f. sp. albedinis]